MAILIVALAFVMGACQAASENLAEQIIEQSSGGEGDVDVDLNTGQVSIETDDGSVTVGGGEVPDGFPIPLPDGGGVQSTFQSGGNASVTLQYSGDRFDELVAFYEDWVAGQPGEWSTSNFTNDNGDGGTMRGHSWWQGADINIGVTDCFSIDTGEFDSTCVTAVVQE